MNTTISQYRRLLKKLLAIEDERGKLGLRFDSSLIDHLPQSPGVYRIFEAGAAWNKSVYVGQSKVRTLRQRVKQHRDRPASSGAELKKWIETSGRATNAVTFFRNNCRVQFVVLDDTVAAAWGLENGEVARSLFEAFAIAVLRPVYNYGRWKSIYR